MKTTFKAACVAALTLAPLATIAEVVKLTPAEPQPDEAALIAGLAVQYSGKFNGRSLEEIKQYDGAWTEGEPLAGMSYDTPEGEMVLTSNTPEKVAALISGYIKFDDAGLYTLEFLSNDGFVISISGEELGLYDGVHDCGYVGEIEVEVPQAGFYPVDAQFFQRKGSSCLLMEWGPDSDGLEQVPDSAFFHVK